MIMRDLRTVFFDAGFTLVRIRPSLGEVYAHVAARLGAPFPAERFQEVGIRVWNRLRLPEYQRNFVLYKDKETEQW